MPSHYPYDIPEPIGGEEADKSLLVTKEIHDVLEPFVLPATKSEKNDNPEAQQS